MRALLPLVVALALLPLAPSASATGDVGRVCQLLTFDHELCVGQEGDCTGVLYRDYVTQREVCVGIHDGPFRP